MTKPPSRMQTALLACAEPYSGFRAPNLDICSDRDVRFAEHEEEFDSEVSLSIPKLLYLLDAPAGEGAITHLAIDILAHNLPDSGWQFNITSTLDGEALETQLFQMHYARRQFLVPITVFRAERHLLNIHAAPLVQGSVNRENIFFRARSYLVSRPRIEVNLGKGAIWLFSTARSGSTWLAMDVLCTRERARPMDETGIGKMFAPLRWDAESFFDPASCPAEVESGIDFPTGVVTPLLEGIPVFRRWFVESMEQENQVFSRMNFDFYHRKLREMAIDQIVNEWGFLDFSRTVFKMPNDSHAADFISRAFPESWFLFLIRDGRDVLKSRFSPFASRILADTANADLRLYAIAFYSHWWNFQVNIIRAAYQNHARNRRMLLRYEEMRRQPEKVIPQIYAQLGYDLPEKEIVRTIEESRLESFSQELRGPDKPRQTGQVGGYRKIFNEEEIELMNRIMGVNLMRYGYEL